MLILATDRCLAIEANRGEGGTFTTQVGEARVLLDDLADDDETFIYRFTLVVEWSDLAVVDIVEAWPSFAVSWWHGQVDDRRVFRCLEADVRMEVGAAVVELVEHLEKRDADLVGERAWLRYPHVEWEPAESWPARAPVRGGYRSAAKERVVARRAKQSFRDWLFASEPDKLADCLTTETHLYARWNDRKGRFRIPLAALRRGGRGRDAVYVFGRGTRFELQYRKGCKVREHLDSLIA